MISKFLRGLASGIEEVAFFIEKAPEILNRLQEDKSRLDGNESPSKPAAEPMPCPDEVEPPVPEKDKTKNKSRNEYARKWREEHKEQVEIYKARAKKKRAAHIAVRSLKDDELIRFQNKILERSGSTDQIISDFFHIDDADVIKAIKDNLCAYGNHYGLTVIDGELYY